MPMFLFADADYSVPINLIIWSICIGVNLGVLYNYYSKNIVGSLVRRLFTINSEENAKTIKELGYKKCTLWHKLVLKDTSSLRKLISVVGGKIPTAKNEEGQEVKDWENARFYIPESKSSAKDAYKTAQKWIYLPIFTILSVIISVLMCFLMPFFIGALPLL